MYMTGDVTISWGTDKDGEGEIFHDARNNSEPCRPPIAYLPHSCDNWIIGGAEQVELFISELQSILKRLKPHKP